MMENAKSTLYTPLASTLNVCRIRFNAIYIFRLRIILHLFETYSFIYADAPNLLISTNANAYKHFLCIILNYQIK